MGVHLINFSARFAGAVDRMEKRQTIRRKRKRSIQPGDVLNLYTGLRTKKSRFLKGVGCESVDLVTILEDNVHCTAMMPGGLDAFARADGFGDWAEMRDWFKKLYGLPFEGVLIKW
jgi:hypothetical protein